MVLQRQQAEQALQQSEERFRGFANAAPAMLWVTEPDGSCSFLSLKGGTNSLTRATDRRLRFGVAQCRTS